MNIIDKQNDILTKANEIKLLRLQKARENYSKRKEEGRLIIKHIPKDDQRKRGPKALEQMIKEPKVRGRKPLLINDVSIIPTYINKFLKEPFHYFKNVGDDGKFKCISSHTEDEREIANNIFNILIDNDDDIIKYDIYTKRYNKNGYWYIKYYLNEGCQSDLRMIIRYNTSSKNFKIEINDNMELLSYNKTMLKNSIDELFDIIADNGET